VLEFERLAAGIEDKGIGRSRSSIAFPLGARNRVEPRSQPLEKNPIHQFGGRHDPLGRFVAPRGSFMFRGPGRQSLPLAVRLVKRALPSPVPIVRTPQWLASRMNGCLVFTSISASSLPDRRSPQAKGRILPGFHPLAGNYFEIFFLGTNGPLALST
jgi:hypothetical protein